MTSEAGFGLWLVQRSRAVLKECEIIDPGRTAVAVFNVAKVDVSKSTITGGDPHGVCARGEAYVAIRDSRVVGAADRACYAYMSARLDLARTEVSANDPSAAAIQVEALRPGDAARLVLDDVVVSEATRGRGVSVAGKVAVTLEGSNELRGPIDSAPAVLRELYLYTYLRRLSFLTACAVAARSKSFMCCEMKGFGAPSGRVANVWFTSR